MAPNASMRRTLTAVLALAGTAVAQNMSSSDDTNSTTTTFPRLVNITEDTPSPNEAIPKPECNASQPVSVRYSATTGRLYLESPNGQRGGCVTVDEIWTARGGGTKVRRGG